MPDPSDAEAWEGYVRKVQAATERRVQDGAERLHCAGVIDHEGRVLLMTTPPDMDPSSETSTITG